MGSDLPIIPVQRMKPKKGTFEARVFWNSRIGLAPALYYAISIPFRPFDSGLDYVAQPERASLELDWLRLKAEDWRALSNRRYGRMRDDDQGSIYLGGAHNVVRIRRLQFGPRFGTEFELIVELRVLFDNEGVGKPADLTLASRVRFTGLTVFKASNEEFPPGEDETTLLRKLAEPAAYASRWKTSGGLLRIAPVRERTKQALDRT